MKSAFPGPDFPSEVLWHSSYLAYEFGLMKCSMMKGRPPQEQHGVLKLGVHVSNGHWGQTLFIYPSTCPTATSPSVCSSTVH